MASVGERIRYVREQRRMTQERLAETTEISKGFLSDVENGKRNVSSDYLLRIADALGTSVDYLLKGDSAFVEVPKAVVIPPELSEAAHRLNLSYAETVELLNAHKSVVARRSNSDVRQFTVDDWISLHKALKGVFG